MLQIAYIAKLNQTNSLIMDTLNVHFDAHVTFIEPKDILGESSKTSVSSPNIVIFDLNTSTEYQNATSKIQRINQLFSDPPLIVIHPYEMKKFVEPLLKAGVNAVLPIAPSEDEIKTAITSTLQGKTFVSL